MIPEYAADELVVGKVEVAVRERLVARLPSLLEACRCRVHPWPRREDTLELPSPSARTSATADLGSRQLARGRGSQAGRLAPLLDGPRLYRSRAEASTRKRLHRSARTILTPCSLTHLHDLCQAPLCTWATSISRAGRVGLRAAHLERLGERRKIAVDREQPRDRRRATRRPQSARDHMERASVILRELDDKPGDRRRAGRSRWASLREDGYVKQRNVATAEAMDSANEPRR